MVALKAFYDLIPKWLLMILVVALAVSSGWLWTKMKYYQVEYNSVKAANMILKGNVETLTKDLDICTKALKAEADNASTQAGVTTDTQGFKKDIAKICVKEDANAKTKVVDAIRMSNNLADRLRSK